MKFDVIKTEFRYLFVFRSMAGLSVDPRSNSTHLICRCNHLTTFGGNFIQAPNPIDFDKVFSEFGNLAESGT